MERIIMQDIIAHLSVASELLPEAEREWWTSEGYKLLAETERRIRKGEDK